MLWLVILMFLLVYLFVVFVMVVRLMLVFMYSFRLMLELGWCVLCVWLLFNVMVCILFILFRLLVMEWRWFLLSMI